MLNFIICDHDKVYLKHIKKLIDNYMMSSDMDYACFPFSNYNECFMEQLNQEKGFNIFLLSIEQDNLEGLEKAHYIREVADDWVSVIIFMSASNEYKFDTMTRHLYILDYLNKLDHFDKNLPIALDKAIKHYNQRRKALSIETNRIIKQIEYRHIVYIEKEPESKICRIRTTYGNEYVNKTIKSLAQELEKDSSRFMKVNQSLIVNLDQIDNFDINETKLTFKNKEVSYLVSRNYKKELIRRLKDKA